MRLSEYIDASHEAIIESSVAFAKQIPALSSSSMPIEILRDHLPLILDEIARDLKQPQSRAESILKSEGRAPEEGKDTAAQMHGKYRALSGLTVEQLVAEFRVLRSSVLRLWSESSAANGFNAEDVMRFNEAIDQAVAESVAYFHAEVEHWRSLLLGVVGHDLRGPLNAILLTSEVLMHEAGGTSHATYADSIARSARRMGTLLDSLLEFNKASLGVGMSLHRTAGDLVSACGDELALIRTAMPDREITFRSPQACQLELDFSRIREALSNLVFNAGQHGAPGSPIDVVLEERPDEVCVSVSNAAETLDETTLNGLFEPLRQRRPEGSRRESRNLGLGLFIVRTIARAHGGDATARMRGGQVTFTISLPAPGRAVP